jgi:hypothetical protein
MGFATSRPKGARHEKVRTVKISVAAADLATHLDALDCFCFESAEDCARATTRERGALDFVLRAAEKESAAAMF